MVPDMKRMREMSWFPRPKLSPYKKIENSSRQHSSLGKSKPKEPHSVLRVD